LSPFVRGEFLFVFDLKQRLLYKITCVKNKKDGKITILAIETSCDETAIAVVDCAGGIKNPRFKIRANIVSSQVMFTW